MHPYICLFSVALLRDKEQVLTMVESTGINSGGSCRSGCIGDIIVVRVHCRGCGSRPLAVPLALPAATGRWRGGGGYRDDCVPVDPSEREVGPVARPWFGEDERH